MILRPGESALNETVEAALYYENKAAGLGAAFLAELKRSTDFILRYPEAAPIVRNKIRRVQ